MELYNSSNHWQAERFRRVSNTWLRRGRLTVQARCQFWLAYAVTVASIPLSLHHSKMNFEVHWTVLTRRL